MVKIFLLGQIVPETVIFSNGDKYVGDYKNGKRSGKGVYYYFKGQKYEGEYKNNQPNGQGTLTFANGERHEGFYKDGKLNGKGKIFFTSGSVYEGEFVEDKASGQGTYVFGVDTPSPGDRYVGSFKDGKKSGLGTFFHSNGNVYVGEHKNDQPNGQGTLTFANGDKFIGEFKEGIQTENGRYIKKAQGRYFSPLLFSVFLSILYAIGYKIRKDEIIKSWQAKLAYSIAVPIMLVSSVSLLLFFLLGKNAGEVSFITSVSSILILIPFSYFTIRNKKDSNP